MQISMPFADATQDVRMCLLSENGRASNLDLGGVKDHLGVALEVDRKRFIGTSRLDIIFQHFTKPSIDQISGEHRAHCGVWISRCCRDDFTSNGSQSLTILAGGSKASLMPSMAPRSARIL